MVPHQPLQWPEMKYWFLCFITLVGAQKLCCKLNPGGPRGNASLGLFLKIAGDQCDDATLLIYFQDFA